jgi:nitrogen fixation NifU-like protein
MTDLRDLYQEVILDHRKQPRNFREMGDANRKMEGFNPLCGDQITLYLKVEDDVIRDVSFQGSGCAISTASASMMTESLVGKRVEEAQELFRKFQQQVTGQESSAAGGPELGKLAVFAGVAEFPVRVKCASLPWHTMRAALEESKEPVTTE